VPLTIHLRPTPQKRQEHTAARQQASYDQRVQLMEKAAALRDWQSAALDWQKGLLGDNRTHLTKYSGELGTGHGTTDDLTKSPQTMQSRHKSAQKAPHSDEVPHSL
jgi:hypothetical protein